MGNENKSYRIRTNVNRDSVINFNMTQTYDKFDILSLTLDQNNTYRLMESNIGVIAGRVLANGGFGVPNAKVSVFIEYEDTDDIKKRIKYHYTSTQDLDYDGIIYNLLSNVDEECHQNVGTFPTKRVMLDNHDWIDIFDKYYKYTTKTNNSGDYMIYGVPTGMQKVHMDVDLSDIGVLSQTPRDMMYKGYNAELFDSPTKFKKSTALSSLVQIISQDNEVYVYPFWGDTTSSTTNAAITRCDINIPYKFEPTCIFMGSVISDTGENALSKKCVAGKKQGKMSELMTGEGRIEMIRKTYDNKVESFSIKGDKVIDENGVWCYQIPMNLDYVVTDEFGNTVLSDNPEKGIPTRTRVRFRLSMSESSSDIIARKRARYLIPNNPRMSKDDYPDFFKTKEIDYEFGSKTKDENFRDLMWNNVYTVKNYVPRLQKSRLPNNLRHTGIKMVNHSGSNNPTPYNNLSIKFNFTYRFLCTISKIIITIVRLINSVLTGISAGFYNIAKIFVRIANYNSFPSALGRLFASIDGKTPDRTGIPGLNDKSPGVDDVVNEDGQKDEEDSLATIAADNGVNYMLGRLCQFMRDKEDDEKPDNWNFDVDKCNIGGLAAFFLVIVYSIGCGIRLDNMCETDDGESVSTTPGTNDTIKEAFMKAGCAICDDNVAKLYNCIENQLAQDNEVTSFNFYNDWLNGVVYLPLWYRKIKPKKKFLGFNIKAKDQYCATDPARYKYKKKMKLMATMVPKRDFMHNSGNMGTIMPLASEGNSVEAIADDETGREMINFIPKNENNCYGYECHNKVRTYQMVKTGFINEKETTLGDLVQYYRPTYFDDTQNKDLITLFATDIVLLGSLNSCDLHGIPQFFRALEGTTYNMPPDLMVEDYEYYTDEIPANYREENDAKTIDKSTRHTEYTGADWGNLGGDQSNVKNILWTNPINNKTYTLNANENMYDNGGLFYGLTCFDSYTKPKSVINLQRICELGVSLDESQEILNTSMVNANSTEDSFDNAYSTLTPDGFVSYDEIYNPDYRSMFATLNSNFLKTKLNNETGLREYDFTHLYVDNFDGSLYNLMQFKTVNGYTEKSNYTEKANYIGNYNLERSSDAYLNFRFGNYLKGDNTKIYYYDYNMKTSSRIESSNRIPRYENSFYFYFGLNEGKTAIDKFNTEYFSECNQKDNLEAAYNISYKANSWCPFGSKDGYIAFTTAMETPIKVIFSDIDNPENSYSVEDIQVNNFYFGTKPASELDGYKQYKLKDELLNISNVLILPNGKYNVYIEDGDGLKYKDKLDFNADYLSYDVVVNSFNCKNSDLEDMFAVVDSYGNLDWWRMFSEIADFGTITRPIATLNRPINGYITVSNINEENYSIVIEPTNSSFFNGNTQLYTGCKVIIENNRYISHSGVGYLGCIDGVYYFGVPYGEQKYTVQVRQLCHSNGLLLDTDNVVKQIVTVSEGFFKMYINGVDYDNIRNFKTGWYSIGNERFSTMNSSQFDVSKMYGWNDLDNIGKYNQNVITPITYTTSLSMINDIGNILDESYNRNANNSSDYTPYTWVSNYCYESSSWESDRISINVPNKAKLTKEYPTGVIDYETVNLYRNVYTNPDLYADYVDTLGMIVITEDENGRLTYTSNTEYDAYGNVLYTYYYSDFEGPRFYDVRTVIDNINNIINKRLEFVKQVKTAFRINYDETSLSLTYNTVEPPVKFLMVGNEETLRGSSNNNSQIVIGNLSNIGNLYVGNAKIFDEDLEESSISFTIPTIKYNNGTYTPIERPSGSAKHPYYVAICDNNRTAKPILSNVSSTNGFAITIDNFGVDKDNPYLTYTPAAGTNIPYKNYMFGVHFYDKPIYFEIVNVFNSKDNFPIYGKGRNNVTLNSFITGYVYNGLIDSILVKLDGVNGKLYTIPGQNEEDSRVKRFIYTDQSSSYGTYNRLVPSVSGVNKQYIEIPNYSFDITVGDGYGPEYKTQITYNTISFSGTEFNQSHYTQSGDVEKDDYIKLSLLNGSGGRYYFYRWNGTNHPFDGLVNGSFVTMPSILVTNTPEQETGYIDSTNDTSYNIGNKVNGNNPIDRFFVLYMNGVHRTISPVFDVKMPRVIRDFKRNPGDTLYVNNIFYITERFEAGTTTYADINNLFYLANYDSILTLKRYNSVTDSYDVTNTINMYHNEIEIVDIHIIDYANGTIWEYDAKAIKVTVPSNIGTDEHAFIQDWLGITKLADEEKNCIVTETV